MNKFFLSISFLILSSCVSTELDRARASNPEFLKEESSTRLSLRKADTELTRYYFKKDNKFPDSATAMPLSGALLTELLQDQTPQAVPETLQKFAQHKSCFYLYVAGQGPAGRFLNYEVSMGNKAGELKTMSTVSNYALEEILNQKFPASTGLRAARSIAGEGLYQRKIFCGEKIDFSKPFSVEMKPTFENGSKVVFEWL